MICVHSSQKGALLVDVTLCASIVHDIAEAFIEQLRRQCPLHQELIKLFGMQCARTYAIDMSVRSRWSVTFSRRIRPKVLLYRGAVASIVDEHAIAFRLQIDDTKLLILDSLSETGTARPSHLHN